MELPLNLNISSEYRHIMGRCLDPYPEERPTAKELVDFSKINKTFLA
jgi:serine/threonine protein kinase